MKYDSRLRHQPKKPCSDGSTHQQQQFTQALLDKRSRILQHALAAGETVTGLIIARALVRPDRQPPSVKLKSVRKHFHESAFARGADRVIIAECMHCGLDVDDFLAPALTAMQGIAAELEL